MKPSLHGFTKMPNWLFLRLPDLSPAGMRVTMVILAESIGWGVEAVILSNADLMRLSGLARSSVQEGIKDALQEQVIERTPYQQSFAYRLKAPNDASPFPWTSLRQSLAQSIGHMPEQTDVEAQPPETPTSTSPEFRPDTSENQASPCPKFKPEPPDFQAGGTEFQAGNSPEIRREVGRNSGCLSAINGGEISELPTLQERRQNKTQEPCEHTHSECPSARVRARPPFASRYRYDEVLAYAKTLKGIRNPGGLAVVYWRSGEMDEEIARFQIQQAAIANQEAEEATQQTAELRALAVELRTRGEPYAEWERDIMAVFADEFEEEHDAPIHRMDVADGHAV